MIAAWILPLLIVAGAGMVDMLLSHRPQGLVENLRFLSVAAITSGALLSVAENALPSWHFIVFTWGVAALMTARAYYQIRRACHD